MLSNFATLSKIYLKKFGMRGHCAKSLMLPWQPYFDRAVFPNVDFFVFIK